MWEEEPQVAKAIPATEPRKSNKREWKYSTGYSLNLRKVRSTVSTCPPVIEPSFNLDSDE